MSTTQTPEDLIRTLWEARRGCLATVTGDDDRQPFGVPINIALDDSGEPYTYLSTVSDVSRHLTTCRRASLVLTSTVADGDDRSVAPSATLVGDMGIVTGIREEAFLRDRFVAVHPYAGYVRFCDFLCWRMEIDRVRLLPGFGRPYWRSAADVRAVMLQRSAVRASPAYGSADR